MRNLPCQYYLFDPSVGNKSLPTVYSCEICLEKIFENIESLKGNHMLRKNDEHVKVLRFAGCEMLKIPKGIARKFKNLEKFLIFQGKIGRLSRNDFAEYSNIKELWISKCEIKHLPADLFELMPKLEVISFYACGIEYIDAKILDCLPNLKAVKFDYNKNISVIYDPEKKFSHLCSYADKVHSFDKLKNMLSSKKLIAPCGFHNFSSAFLSDVKKMMCNNQMKDFRIIADGKEFKAHKFILAARSSVFAKLILEHPEVNTFDLKCFSAETFSIILNFMYDDKMPDFNAKNVDGLIKIADRLEIHELKTLAIEYIKSTFTLESVYESFKLAKMQKDKIREQAAWSFIEKQFPIPIDIRLQDDLEGLKKVLDAKIQLENEKSKKTDAFIFLPFIQVLSSLLDDE